jgi:hypothetical protein
MKTNSCVELSSLSEIGLALSLSLSISLSQTNVYLYFFACLSFLHALYLALSLSLSLSLSLCLSISLSPIVALTLHMVKLWQPTESDSLPISQSSYYSSILFVFLTHQKGNCRTYWPIIRIENILHKSRKISL